MRIGLAIGTPVCDGLWIGSVVANIGGNVLAIELGGDALDEAAWRVFPREQVMLSHGIAHTVRDDDDRARIVRSWHKPCGRLDVCECESAMSSLRLINPKKSVPDPTPTAQPRLRVARQQPGAIARPRPAAGVASVRPAMVGAQAE